MMFSKFLVAVDGSEFSDRAFDAAIVLAKSLNAEVMAVNIVPMPVPAEGIGPDSVLSLEKSYQRDGELLFRYATMAKERYGLQIGTKVAKGHTGRKILEIAYQNKANLIIMGHRGTLLR